LKQGNLIVSWGLCNPDRSGEIQHTGFVRLATTNGESEMNWAMEDGKIPHSIWL